MKLTFSILTPGGGVVEEKSPPLLNLILLPLNVLPHKAYQTIRDDLEFFKQSWNKTIRIYNL